jgi:hypothetical protein
MSKSPTNAQINEINILASRAGYHSATEAIAHHGYGDIPPGKLDKRDVAPLKVALQKDIVIRTPAPELTAAMEEFVPGV